jgi:hypothetical protein
MGCMHNCGAFDDKAPANIIPRPEVTLRANRPQTARRGPPAGRVLPLAAWSPTPPEPLAGIPDLLRRCSPVVHETIDHENWASEADPPPVKVRAVIDLLYGGSEGTLASVGYEQCGVPCQEDDVPLEELELDVDDETGHAHAAAYCIENGPALWPAADLALLRRAALLQSCDVGRLRTLVLQVAERRKEADRG